MKLVRYGNAGEEKPGLIDAGGTLRDLSGVVDDISGAVLGDAGLDRLRALDHSALPAVEGNPRFGACVGQIGKFMCIGLDYSDHAAETGDGPHPHADEHAKHEIADCRPGEDQHQPVQSGIEHG